MASAMLVFPERQILVEAIGLVDQGVVAGRAIPFRHEFHHRVAVDGERQSPADADVVEQFLVAAEDHVQELARQGAKTLHASSRADPLVVRRRDQGMRSVSPAIRAEASAVGSGVTTSSTRSSRGAP